MTNTFKTLSKLCNILVVVSMLINSLAFSQVVQAKAAPPVPAEPALETSLVEETSYGSGWRGVSLPESQPVARLSEQLAAQATDYEEEARLKVSVEPEIYIPGKPIQIHWSFRGRQLDPTAEIVVFLNKETVPANEEFAKSFQTDGELRFAANEKDGNTIDLTVKRTTKEPLEMRVVLQERGKILDEQIIILGEANYTEEKITTGNIEAFGGKVRLSLPDKFASEALVMDVRSPSPHSTPALSLTGNPIEIIAVGTATGKNVTKFNSPVTLQIEYDESHIFDWREENLQVFYYDEEIEDWFPLATEVDTKNNTLTAQTDHLTVFDYKASSWQGYDLPTVDDFKVAGFTGAGTYGINLWTPPGTAGLQPQLTLQYNSQVIDDATSFSQASWVGMGWSMDTGAITTDLHGTTDDPKDDTYSISLSGISSQLLPIGNSEYVTANRSYDKIIYNDTNKSWKVYGTDGTLYEFLADDLQRVSGMGSVEGCAATTADLTVNLKWSLSSVTDKFGNTMTYEYEFEEKSSSCKDQIAVYPKSITYANDHYRVFFERDNLRTDYQQSWADSNSIVLYRTGRLKKVLIQHYPENGSAWETIRQYELSYVSGDTNLIYPHFVFSGGGRTLTLAGIQELDGDGNAYLPAVQFFYGDFMHLTKVDNGQGGRVTLTYEVQTMLDTVNKKERAFYVLYGTDQCTYPLPYHSWSGSSGLVGCSPDHYLHLSSNGVAQHTIPEHIYKVGGWYHADIKAGAGGATDTTLKYGLINTYTQELNVMSHTDIDSTQRHLTEEMQMDILISRTNQKLYLECSDCKVQEARFSLMPIVYRCATRTVSDLATGQSTTFTYNYDNASTNTEAVSQFVSEASTDTDFPDLYNRPYREFRGHSMSRIKNEDDLSTVTWYYQSDELKGSAYRTLTMQENFFDEFNTLSTTNWTAGSTGTNSVPDKEALIAAARVADEPLTDFDTMLKSEGESGDGDVTFARSSSSLSNGETAIFHFRLSGDNAHGKVGLLGSEGQYFGIELYPDTGGIIARTLYNTGSGSTTGDTLIQAGTFQRDKWYAVMFIADASNGFRGKIWQVDDPTATGEFSIGGLTDASWKYTQTVNNGVLWLDAYMEGVLYNESETKYVIEDQYDTDSATTIPNLSPRPYHDDDDDDVDDDGEEYTDLQVVWTYPTETIQRNYEGFSTWDGVRQEYSYLETDQNSNQYGNLTRVTYSGGDESGWTAHHATRTQYWPTNTSNVYLVSLPARSITLDCESGCDFNGESDLLSASLNIYDSNPTYSVAPTAGKL
ncbi:MAG: hypothetical protein K8R77_04560, partial [Anaerolineaceae bacterium]|nr:hypothetical protein [Anaerolineaceae bacterium]